MTRNRMLIYAGVIVLAAAGAVWLLTSGTPDLSDCTPVPLAPTIFPDYTDITLPPNIAPINFTVKESGTGYVARIASTTGETITVHSRTAGIVIPPEAWRRLLDTNKGEPLTIEVFVRNDAGRWRAFEKITNQIALEPIDRYVVYRDMPVYNLHGPMQTVQHDLETAAVTPVLRGVSYNNGCANCHLFLNKKSGTIAMNVRGPRKKEDKKKGPKGGLVLARNGVVERIALTNTAFNPIPAIYIAWHPSGRAVTFATVKFLQCFHTIGDNREGVDEYSDIGIYLIDRNMVSTSPKLSRPHRMETWPHWSPDGKTLYYCDAEHFPRLERRKVHYDLMRISYDIDTNTWGDPVTMFTWENIRTKTSPDFTFEKSLMETGGSFMEPKCSPDGKHVLVCGASYGNLPTYLRDSDFYMVDNPDSDTPVLRHLDKMSAPNATDSWHTWSSNSRWVVFVSKRMDPLFARAFISYIDVDGNATKGFALPQRDAGFYESCIRAVNFPEMVTEPVSVPEAEFVRALFDETVYRKAILDPAVPPEPPLKSPDKSLYVPGDIQ